MEKKHPVSGQTQDNLRRLKPLSAIADLKDSTANKGDNQREKQDYVEKIPKQEGGSRPNPLLDVYLANYFWHAKIILRC